jgi:hypothetical protein
VWRFEKELIVRSQRIVRVFLPVHQHRDTLIGTVSIPEQCFGVDFSLFIRSSLTRFVRFS